MHYLPRTPEASLLVQIGNDHDTQIKQTIANRIYLDFEPLNDKEIQNQRSKIEKNTEKNSYFKSRINRLECARIQLLGNSEFIAKNVVLTGNFELVVQAGKRAIITQGAEDKLNIEMQDIDIKHPDSINWTYSFDKDNNIKLSS